MDKILIDFGVQPIYLAAQIVNFLILLIVLKKFLYKPILKILEDRKKTVSDSLVNAEKIALQRQLTEQESAQKLLEASRQAQIIVDNASNCAKKIIADAHEKAKTDIDVMIEQGKESILAEREILKNELQKELADLVLLGIERVVGKVLDHPEHMKIFDQTIENLKDEHSAKGPS